MKNINETLKLFNAVRVDTHNQGAITMLERTVPHGFVLSPSVSAIADDVLIDQIRSFYLSTSKANQAFHKSWQTIKDTPQEELWMQAIIHYFTTYGYDALGIEGEVYIPAEQLDIPNDIKLINVIGLTDNELQEKILELGSGIALSKDTLEAIIHVIEGYGYKIEVDRIQNRELKSALYDLYDIVPQDPTEYLRFVISRLTGKTLLIKSKKFIDEIKECESQIQRRELDRLIQKAPASLPEIFFRYKPLFLALKHVSSNKSFFNKLRKNANVMHKPLSEDYLNSITGRIKNGRSIEELDTYLKGATLYRKIRLANALKFRMASPQSIVYKIRNGRSWVDDFVFKNTNEAEKAYSKVVSSMKIDKTVYMPDYIDYALPATEKQFIGNIPSNTKISVPDNLIVGVYWENVGRHRIDLDFSSISMDGKIGWNSSYKSTSQDVLFSGDMTDAQGGASELMYFGQEKRKTYALLLNYYNFDEDVPVPAKVFVAHEVPKNFSQNYVANNIIMQAEIKIEHKQTFLGVVYGNSLFLSSSAIGNSISSGGDRVDKIRQFLLDSTTSAVRLSDIVNVSTVRGKYPDFSPEVIDKSSFINLLK